MKYVSASVLAFFILFSGIGCGSSARKGSVLPTGFYQNGDAVVTVRKIGFSMGTGFVVDRDGLVITNNHVVARSDKETSPSKFEICQILNETEVCSPAVVLAVDPKLDLALMKTKTKFPSVITFVQDDKLSPFDYVYAWASVANILPPSPFSGRYTGKVTPSRRQIVERDLLIIDLSSNPGGSGSPVFDWQGLCIGIIVGVTNFGGASLTVAIPAYDAVKFLEANGVTQEKPPRQ